jgi:hypothetical protein
MVPQSRSTDSREANAGADHRGRGGCEKNLEAVNRLNLKITTTNFEIMLNLQFN